MSKYDYGYDHMPQRPPVVPGETVLLQIKPKKNAFVINKVLGVGDIYFDTGAYHMRKGRQITDYKMFLDIEDPHGVYERVQKIVMDIQADIEFPNAYRPEDNPGYNTKYSG